MSRRFITKLLFIAAILVTIGYLSIPNINIILSKIDSKHYKEIKIFYTNDIHGHISMDRTNNSMGMPLVQSLIDRNSGKGDNVILLDAGDTFYGSNETDLNEGQPMVDIMNKMNYAAMAVGNHEFDFGFDQTLKLTGKTKFPALSVNLYKDGKRIFQPYTILQEAGINIGVIGLSTSETLTRTKPEYVKGVTVKDDFEAIKEILPEVKAKSDFIILLGHEHDATLEDIGKQFKDINLIIAGHDHVAFNNLEKCGSSYLVSSGVILRKLGEVRVVFKDKKPVYLHGKLLGSKSRNSQDKQILGIVNNYHDKIFNQLNVKIGETKSALTDQSRAYFEEVNFGNAITDAMREYVKADVAIQNGGGIRSNIAKGDLTLYNINEAFPFVNYVIEVEMNGKEIKQAIEHGIEKYPSGWNGGFPQVSGMTYTFDAAKPSGKRLVGVYIGGKGLDDNKTYTVATNDYLYQGGDGYDVIKNSKMIYNSGLLIKDVFTLYVKQKKSLDAKIEGRIKILNLKNNF
jgi:5'-nucleotidase / UDP-sugar diphosphatase